MSSHRARTVFVAIVETGGPFDVERLDERESFSHATTHSSAQQLQRHAVERSMRTSMEKLYAHIQLLHDYVTEQTGRFSAQGYDIDVAPFGQAAPCYAA